MFLLSPIDAAAPRRAGPLSRSLRVLLAVLLTNWGLLLIAWLALHWAILPHIEQWRGPIEVRVGQALGAQIRIGHIAVRTGSWVPAFELRDVVVLDPASRPALRLPHVVASISARSLLGFELRFRQLLIDGAELDVRRDTQGRIFVAGLDMGSTSGPTDERASADWFFAQHEFVIRGGSLRWTDEQRQAPPLALTNVQLVVRNSVRHHDIRLDATPPAAWGDAFSVVGRFTQPLLARPGDLQQWSGSAYASLPRADLRELQRHLSLPFDLIEGVGAVRGWFELREGQPAAATVDLAVRAVALRLQKEADVLEIEQLHGRFIGERHGDGISLALQRFSFVTGDGLHWPQGDIGLRWNQADGAPADGGAITAQHLDLGVMAQIASRIPLGAAVRELLATLNPRGGVRDLSATWQGPLDSPRRYRAKATLDGVSLDALASSEPDAIGRPGLRNASLQLDASETGGSARLTVDAGAIELPGVFDEPLLPLDRLQAQLAWQITPGATGSAALPKVTVQVNDARFANADARGELSATWTTGPGTGVGRDGRYPGQLRLDSRLTDAVAARTARYLPLGLPHSVRDYVVRAVRSGSLPTANFHVNGRLWDFPFAHARASKDGEFHVTARLADVGFAYVPDAPASGTEAAFKSPWPALEHVNGELVIDRTSLAIRDATARLGGVDWHDVRGGIPNLEAPELALDALGRGPLTEMLKFVGTTPIGGWMSGGLAQASASGSASIALRLNVPIEHADAARVKGSLALAGNDLRIAPDAPLLAAAHGRVDFSDQGFAVVGATAQLFGGELAFEGGSQPSGALRFTGQGTASAEGLRHAAELPELAHTAAVLSGQAAYRVALGVLHGRTEVDVSSNLVGASINLPAPLNKAADSALALHYQTALVPASLAAGQVPQDEIRFELGNTLQARYLRDLSGPAPRVLRGGVGVGEPAPQPAAGVAASVNLPTLDVDAWEAGLARLAGPPEAAPAAPAADGGYRPSTIALRARALRWGARRLDNLVAGVSQVDGLWRANLEADQLGGYVEYRPPVAMASSGASVAASVGASVAASAGGASAAAGRVYARLARLSLPKGDDDQVAGLLDQAPASVPALDVVVDDFELRGKRLGRLEVEAVNRIAGEGRDARREWRLAKLKLTTPEAQLSATGQWVADGSLTAPRRTSMDFQLALQDSGALLSRLGTPNAIRGGRGQLAGQVSWRGSPLSLDVASLVGQIRVAIDSGQFLHADPGAARLLGVLSLQSLPRRFSLDFRDLFQEGFAFDNITGDVAIHHGEAETNNLRMRGVQAVVLMDGRADIVNERQDLRVWVVPEINAGTASLAYAVINPVIGLGTFLAQIVLGKPLAEANTRQFRIHGPWADPKVDSVARRFGDDVPPLNFSPDPSANLPVNPAPNSLLELPPGAASAPNALR